MKMRIFTLIFLAILAALLFVGCGGGSDNNTVSPPVIVNPGPDSYVEPGGGVSNFDPSTAVSDSSLYSINIRINTGRIDPQAAWDGYTWRVKPGECVLSVTEAATTRGAGPAADYYVYYEGSANGMKVPSDSQHIVDFKQEGNYTVYAAFNEDGHQVILMTRVYIDENPTSSSDPQYLVSLKNFLQGDPYTSSDDQLWNLPMDENGYIIVDTSNICVAMISGSSYSSSAVKITAKDETTGQETTAFVQYPNIGYQYGGGWQLKNPGNYTLEVSIVGYNGTKTYAFKIRAVTGIGMSR
jgi:hypothetical protein